MTKIIAVANQKGGVGKTTSTINISACLAKMGHKVLAIDLDPQASLTIYTGHDPRTLDDEEKTIYYGLISETPLSELIISGSFDLIASSIRLATGEAELILSPYGKATILREKVEEIRDQYDFILIDCPPTLTLITVNALSCADYVLIPVKTDYLSLMGIPLLLESIEQTTRKANRNLKVLGVLPTMYNPRYGHDIEALTELKNSLEPDVKVFEPIHRSTNFDKAPSEGRATIDLLPNAPSVQNYYKLAEFMTTL